jgi:hypothetical protein
VFNSGGESQIYISARLGFYGSTTTGTAWFDDLRLEPFNVPASFVQNPGFEQGSANQPDHWAGEIQRRPMAAARISLASPLMICRS